MLKVNRTSLPQDLTKTLNQRQSEANLSIEAPTKIWKTFSKSPEYKKVQEHLQKMFNSKCAYCEDNEPTQIEHFWPKSPFKANNKKGSPTKMFVWENLFLSCHICNGFSCKGSKMEWDANGHPKLLDPCVEDPFQFFSIIVDVNDTNLGWIDPLLELQIADLEKASYTIRLFKLNLRAALRKGRKKTIVEFYTLLEGLKKYGAEFELPAGVPLRKRFLDFMEASQPYLAPLRQILIENPEFHHFLLQEIPELEPVLEKWFLPLES